MNQATTVVQNDTHAENHEELSFLYKYILPVDHKIIGMQYIFTGLIMAVIGGYFAYAFRMQLAFPGQLVPLYGLVGPGEYNMLVTNHGTIMIFWVAMPVLIAGFGNFLIPLMIGCDDMVFPRLNRLSYQIFLVSTLVLISSFFVAGGGFGHTNCSMVYSGCSNFVYGISRTTRSWSRYALHGPKTRHHILPSFRWR